MIQRNQIELIIVPGHGICRAGKTHPEIAPLDSSWVGIFPGEGPFYIEHIKSGVIVAAKRQSGLLVFSGGQTRERAGRRSEAESYWEIAEANGWWEFQNVKERTIKEEYARDSFENLVFSIALFKRETEHWPNKITVVGWQFKKERYDLHRQAIKWPKKEFKYVGVNNPVGEALHKALEGEKRKVESVKRDKFLVGSQWVSQRELRNPFHQQNPYRGIDAKLDSLFDSLNRHTFENKLPWVAGDE